MLMVRLVSPLVVLLLVTRVALAATPAESQSSLRVPEGFTVEVVAAAPLVQHPLMAGFDELGRLYVADNAGLNLSAEELEKQLPNSIRCLEDTDGDGRFEKATTFADKMTFPQGAAWFRGALYVASPPNIWRLEDTDDDGVADKRDAIVGRFGYIGNAADIHGCFITPTGRIAWCDGRHGHEFKDAAGQTTSQGEAARIFTCLPDGSDVEVFCGGGMDNPVEVAFTGEGEPLGTMTFYNPDDARHDALVHYVFGGVYPRKHPCTSEFKQTGPLMPALSRFGVTAPSGLTRYNSSAWGDAYRDNFFSAQFNTHNVLRHVLTRSGATFTAKDEEFLVSSDADFHPTDVLVDADGSLLVIDTGGWFRIGCPTSQIAKPEIGGAIYRIRKTGDEVIADPRGLKIDWERTSDTEIADLLADPRPAVVERATEFLVPRGDAAMGALATALFEGEYRSRQNAMWALARINTENSRLLLRQALADDDIPGRVAAVNAVGDIRDAEAILPLIDRVLNDEPPVRREAATALGRLKKAEAVPAILKALRKPADRFEEHALIYALIEINDRKSTIAGLNDAEPNVRRAALIALDQMTAGNLTREMIAPLLAGDDTALLQAVIDILARHPDWAAELDSTLAGWLKLAAPTAEQHGMIRGAVVALVARPAVQQLVAAALVDQKTKPATRLVLLEALAAAEGDLETNVFDNALAKNLSDSDSDVLRQAIFTAVQLAPGRLAEPLLAIGLNERRPTELRVAALCAAAGKGRKLPETGFAFLRRQFDKDDAMRERLGAAEALGRFDLSVENLGGITPLFEKASPLEASWLLQAFAQNTDPQTGRQLVAALKHAAAVASLSPARVREALAHYPADVQATADELLKSQVASDGDRAAALETFLTATEPGDAARGEETFFGQRAACAACHRVGERGEKIGPDLSKIGTIRNRRDLAEAVLFPSASLARGYESFGVMTKDGQVHSGLMGRQTAMAVYLRTTERAEIRVPRDDIEQLVPNATSIMPQGLEKILSPNELSDVIAYLESLR
jgi:putative membrane-bound dehydrogenase-like protein